MAHELLFEIGTEEIPAGYILPALTGMRGLLEKQLHDLSLSHAGMRTAATPRRLTVAVAGLAERQPDRREEVVGPPRQAAFDAAGKPTKAAEGFARSRGIAMEQTTIIATERGEYLGAIIEKKGRPTAELLQEILPAVVKGIPFPKSMRWGAGRIFFARPIQWLLVRFGGEVVAVRLENLEAGGESRGHRFLAPSAFAADGFEQYLAGLRARHVLADIDERRAAVVAAITAAAERIGGTIPRDDELVEVVTNLVEKPHAVCGTFEERFLVLPREVLITSMREHQKYFAVEDRSGRLLPCFIAVNNTDVKSETVAVEGHQRVLRARLEDAFFFFREDRHKTLDQRAEQLDGIIFQNKLGTMREKSSRLTELAGWLAERLSPAEAGNVRRAAALAKADLLTEMVGEFPTLQGIMGREYARIEGEPEAVAVAIHEHYQPVRAGGELPASTTGAIVGLADRMDTVVGCFGIGEVPSGTADPFGLRRLTIGFLAIVEAMGFPLALAPFIDRAIALYGDRLSEPAATIRANVLAFIRGRFVNDLIGRGLPQEAVEAAAAVDFSDLVDCRRRIDALVAIGGRAEFTLLAGSFKRVNNIIKDNADITVRAELLGEPAERELAGALASVTAKAAPLLAAGRYGEALLEILAMKDPVDSFFDKVMVMAEDAEVRQNRLNLLTGVARLFLRVGDFSRMYAMKQGEQP
ncbi:MAG: glycine--tRNA ligase subunit beta [Thermodesulfobacteriota bacterium]